MPSVQEQWRPVPGYEGHYEASDLGRVRSITRVVASRSGPPQRRQGRMLAFYATPDGYQKVRLSLAGVEVSRFVHQIIALTFHGSVPADHHVDHINRRRDDNRECNLRYLHKFENYAQGGASSYSKKLTPDKVRQIMRLRGQRIVKDIASSFGVSVGTIEDIFYGRNWWRVTGMPKPPSRHRSSLRP